MTIDSNSFYDAQLDGEVWRDVPDFEGFYQVSNLGRVKSLSRVTGKGTLKERIIGRSSDKWGYRMVGLSPGDGRIVYWRVHVLVAHVFLGKRPEGLEVNHRNGDKFDNSVANLEYCTPMQNMRHASRHNLLGTARTDDGRRRKAEVRARRASGESIASIAKSCGLSKSGVRYMTRDMPKT